MRKKTYRALIILSVIVVVISVVAAVCINLHRYSVKTDNGALTVDATPLESDPVLASENSSQDEATPSPSESSFIIHFFDVGEADSALIECDGHYMLIDGGKPTNSSFLYSYLKQHGIKYLDYIICSHPHTDHAGGLAGALNYASVGTAYAPVTGYDKQFNLGPFKQKDCVQQVMAVFFFLICYLLYLQCLRLGIIVIAGTLLQARLAALQYA